MVKIRYVDKIYDCLKAVKKSDSIELYESDLFNPSISFFGISDFSAFELLEGEWSYPEPTREELLQAQIDYLSMMSGIDLEV